MARAHDGEWVSRWAGRNAARCGRLRHHAHNGVSISSVRENLNIMIDFRSNVEKYPRHVYDGANRILYSRLG